MNDDIRYDRDDAVALVTLDRPERLNAFTPAMLHALRAVLRRAANDHTVRAVLLTGSGRAFNVGQDLDDPAVSGEDADFGALLEDAYNPVVRDLRALEKPVVVAVNGVAAGAGANLALAGDIGLAARSAVFIQAFAKIGLLPDSGGTWFLPRLVGEARARALAMLGDRVTAEEAAAWGMIWQVVDDDALMTEATALARRLAAGPTRAFAAIKRAIDAAATSTLDEQLDLERDLQRELGWSRDYREGVAAFLEKREPRFEGR